MKILVFGDSHSVYFGLNDELRSINEAFKGVNLESVAVHGSTILGFGKRKSTLNSRNFFVEKLQELSPDYVCFALGQVDIELGLYYRLVVKSEPLIVQEYIENLVDAYIAAVESVQAEYSLPDRAICFKGINLSVLTHHRPKAIAYTSRIITENIEDKGLIKEYTEKLNDVFPSNIERYKNHLHFNELLAKKISGRFSYFDINDELRDPGKFGCCRLEFIPARKDHHIVDSLFVRELSICRLIKACLGF